LTLSLFSVSLCVTGPGRPEGEVGQRDNASRQEHEWGWVWATSGTAPPQPGGHRAESRVGEREAEKETPEQGKWNYKFVTFKIIMTCS